MNPLSVRPRWATTLIAACALAASSVPALAGGPAISILTGGRSPISGIQDDRLVSDPDPAARVKLAADAGAALVRVDLRWDLVAPNKPAAPTNPADPAYQWGRYDTIVNTARSYGVEVLFTVYGTPAWARDPGVPFDARFENFAIRPRDAADFGAFGEAAAKRYGPLGVTKWEGWNEPNISIFLRPQYVRSGARWAAASPKTYSDLLKAFYAGVKKASPSAVVAGGVTAPAGDRCSDCPLDAPPIRVTPDDFMAELATAGLQPPMDAVSHHPYPLTGPRDTTPGGRTYVDLYNLDVLTRLIDRGYLAGKPLWLTEYGFATKVVPAYDRAFPAAKQGPYIVDAYRRIRANRRVAVAVYYLLQDHAQWASGVLSESGAKKPGYQGLALPFFADATSVRAGAAVSLTGQVRTASTRTPVQIQRKSGSTWVTARTLRTSRDGTFRVGVRPSSSITLRARWTGTTRSGTKATRTSPPVTISVR